MGRLASSKGARPARPKAAATGLATQRVSPSTGPPSSATCWISGQQDDPPENAAIAVKYRNRWFYIDLLGTLTALQASKVERAGLLLPLPVAGHH